MWKEGILDVVAEVGRLDGVIVLWLRYGGCLIVICRVK
jgi:hypothetical protein